MDDSTGITVTNVFLQNREALHYTCIAESLPLTSISTTLFSHHCLCRQPAGDRRVLSGLVSGCRVYYLFFLVFSVCNAESSDLVFR